MLNDESTKPRLVALKTISQQYSIPLSTLRRWASERKFPLVKVSNRVKVCPIEFDNWVMQNHYQPQIKGGEDNEK